MATIPPDTRTTGSGSPAADMDNVADVLALLTGAAAGGSVSGQRLLANVVSKTGNYTAAATDFLIACNATGGGFTVTLPASPATGQVYAVKKTDSSANAVTVSPGAGTIDGLASISLAFQYDWVLAQWDGTNWQVAGGNANNSQMRLVASTGTSGFALQNGTPSILTWTAPNDGKMHRVLIPSELNVTSPQTGGQVEVSIYGPDGGNHLRSQYAGGLGTSFNFQSLMYLVEANTTVTLEQTTAQTAGAATLYAEIWAL